MKKVILGNTGIEVSIAGFGVLPMGPSQLEICGVDYFDFYLMHAQNAEYFEKYKKCRAYETAFALNEEGKASDCIKCGKCEHVCPQHLKIRELLVEVAEVFDKTK